MQVRLSHLGPPLLVALALAAGCAPPPATPGPAGFALAPAEGLRMLTEPTTQQWSTGLVNNAEIQRRRTAHQRQVSSRALQSVSTSWSSDPDDFGNPSASGKLSAAPSYHYYTKECFWITETGWLLKYNRLTAATSAWRISTTDSFPNTSITLSNDGKRAYVVSAQGNLHAVSTVDGTQATGSPLALGGTNANVTFGTPVFIDPLASRPDSTFETLYAVTATGVLKRVNSTRAGTVNTITLADSYAVPYATPGGVTELVRSSPVVLGGKAVITTWRRSTAGPYDHANDKGAVAFYDTKVTAPTTASTAGTAAQIVAPITIEAPLWASPAVEVNDALSPILAFVPAGTGVAMFDLVNGRVARSVPLVVDSTATASGNLGAYTYTSGTTALAAKYPKTNGVATINGLGTMGTAQVYGAKRISSADANPVFGYLRFDLTDAELTASNVLKAVFGATLTLRCDASSNESGAFHPLPPRIFRAHNQLSSGTGADWTSANLAYATRPPHMDGTAFDQVAATFNARTTWELTRTGTSVFVNGLDYSWNAKGKIGQAGQDYTIGFGHTQLYESPSLFGGLVSEPAPRFLGGSVSANRPRLTLSVSNAGMTSPSISAPVALDSLDQQIYVANTNALFKLSYTNAATNWVQGAASFSDDDQTRFALTSLGSNASAGPLHTGSTRFVENTTAPLFDGTYVYVHDNHPTYLRSAITRFTPGAAAATPSVSASLLLPNGSSDTSGTAPYMSYDYESNRLFVATYNASTSASRAWLLTRF